MKKILFIAASLILLSSPVWTEEQLRYLDQNKSQIIWKDINVEEWLNFKKFEARQKLKDEQPEWENILLEKNRNEIMGRVVDCIGICRIYKGLGFHHTQFRSTIREGDEFTTIGNSYAWIYLFDGTLVRVSPDSSLTFKEINIGKKEFFLHARINYGNILWLSREKQKIIENNDRETDTYFLPISLFDANQVREEKRVDEDNLFALLDTPTDNLNHLKRMNQLVEENNATASKKRTYVLLVAPNGSISGYEPMIEFIVLLGSKSYIKKRTREFQGYPPETANPELTFYFRGYENQITLDLPDGQWMEIERTGRLIEPYLKPELFSFGELLSKRVTTIMIAREMFFKSYSQKLFEIEDRLELARDYGYRIWGEMAAINNAEKEVAEMDEKVAQKQVVQTDLDKRFSFLVEYTRRLETSNILNANKLSRDLKVRGEKLTTSVYTDRFYRTALATYLNNVEMKSTMDSDREIQNSTTKKYWKMINAKR